MLRYWYTYFRYSELTGSVPSVKEVAREFQRWRRSSALIFLSRVGLLLHNTRLRESAKLQRQIVERILPDDLQRQVFVRWKKYPESWVFTYQQVSAAMKLALSFCGETRGRYITRRNHRQFGALLLKVSDILESIEAEDLPTEPTRRRVALAGSVMRNQLFHAGEQFRYALLRYNDLFVELPRRLPASEVGFGVDKAFRAVTGVSILSFMAMGFALTARWLDSELQRDGYAEVLLKTRGYFKRSALAGRSERAFFRRISLPAWRYRRELSAAGALPPATGWSYNLLPFLRYPVARLRSNVSVCLSKKHLQERFCQGIYWSIADSLDRRQRQAFTRFFGRLFHFYCSDLLSHMFAGTFLTEIKYGKNGKLAFDGAKEYPKEFVVFEFKSAKLRYTSTVLTGDIEAFRRDCDTLIVRSAKQFTRHIEAFRGGAFKIGHAAYSDVTHIWPVVVTIQDFPVGELLDDIVDQMVDETGLYADSKVQRLTVVDVEELEMAEPLLATGVTFLEMLKQKKSEAYRHMPFKNFLFARYYTSGELPNLRLKRKWEDLSERHLQALCLAGD